MLWWKVDSREYNDIVCSFDAFEASAQEKNGGEITISLSGLYIFIMLMRGLPLFARHCSAGERAGVNNAVTSAKALKQSETMVECERW